MNTAENLQDLLLSIATGGTREHDEYLRLREAILADASIAPLVPQFVSRCRDAFQFWEFIKHRFSTYADRRQFIWDEFRPLLEAIDKGGLAPADVDVAAALGKFESADVQALWSRALERRNSDPDGAITLARTLLETVCKHILDESNAPYSESADLPSLYRLTSDLLNLSPGQHTEDVFKRILGGCVSVVEGLGALRNKLGDSHGGGIRRTKPAKRHAELAVNLAGSMAVFLVETYQARSETAT